MASYNIVQISTCTSDVYNDDDLDHREVICDYPLNKILDSIS